MCVLQKPAMQSSQNFLKGWDIKNKETLDREHVLQPGHCSKDAIFISSLRIIFSQWVFASFGLFQCISQVITYCPQPLLLIRVIDFVLSEPLKRLTLCVYWLVMIAVSVRRFYSISKNSKTERILLRKYYHLMAVAIFVPALIFQVLWFPKIDSSDTFCFSI